MTRPKNVSEAWATNKRNVRKDKRETDSDDRANFASDVERDAGEFFLRNPTETLHLSECDLPGDHSGPCEAHLDTEASPHPYCPDEDGRCQYGRDESCPGIGRIDDDPLHTGEATDDVADLLAEERGDTKK